MACSINLKFDNVTEIYENGSKYDSLEKVTNKILEQIGRQENKTRLLNEWFNSEDGLESLKNIRAHATWAQNHSLDEIKTMISDIIQAKNDLAGSEIERLDLNDDYMELFSGNALLEVYRLNIFRRNIFKSLILRHNLYEEVFQNKVEQLQKLMPPDPNKQYTDFNEYIVDCLKDIKENKQLKFSEQEKIKIVDIIKELIQPDIIVTDSASFNLSIAAYKNSQYILLGNFVKKYIDKDFKVERSYRDKYGNVKRSYIDNLLEKFRQYIRVSQSNISLDIALEQYLSDGVLDDRLQAIYAYLNVVHFDETIEQEFGDLIKIDKTLPSEPSQYASDGKSQLIKYTIDKDTSATIKDWRAGEIRDAIKLTTKFEKVLIGSLVLYDRNTGVQLESKIDQSTISNAWGNLVATACKWVTSSDEQNALKEAILLSHDNLNKYIPIIFNLLFNRVNSSLQKSLLAVHNGQLNDSDLDVLYSIYAQLISEQKRDIELTKSQSIKKIEDYSIRSGLTPTGKYLLQDIIYGIFDRSQPINYTRTRYEGGEAITEIISKHGSLQSQTHDLIDSLNIGLERSSYDSRQMVLDKYDIKIENPSIIYITLNKDTDSERKYKISATKSNNNSVFDTFVNDKSIGVIVTPILNDEEKDFLYKLQTIIPGLQPDQESLLDLAIEDPFKDQNKKNQIIQLLENITKSLKSEYDKQMINNILNVLQYNYSSILNKSFGSEIQKNILSKDPQYKETSELLQFIDDFLRLHLLTPEGLQTLGYFKINGGSVRNMFIHALQIAYKQRFLSDFDVQDKESSFTKYLEDHDNNAYTLLINNKRTAIKRRNGKVFFVAASKEDWIDPWCIAQNILSGRAIDSSTRGLDGNARPNYRPSSLGSLQQTQYNLYKLQKEDNSPAKSTLFVQNPFLIEDVVYGTELGSWDKHEQMVKNSNTGELLYNAIAHDFFNKLLTSKQVQIMPTVYSDKISFALFVVSMKSVLDKFGMNNQTLLTLNEEQYIQLYTNTVGSYLVKQHENILNDLAILFGLDTNKTYQELEIDVNNKLKQTTKYELEQNIREWNKNHQDQQLNIGEDIHYRINKTTGRLCLNEISTYYYDVFSRPNQQDTIKERFQQEKFNFIKALIDNNVRFYTESVLTDETVFKNIIRRGSEDGIKLFQSSDESKEYEKEWVKNGRLIIAKYKGKELFYSSDLIGVDINQIELNPLLQKYFYVDNIVSGNIKYAILGNEIADPLKAANLDFTKDFNPISKNSDGSNKDQTELDALNLFSEEEITELQHTDLVSLSHIINQYGNEMRYSFDEQELYQSLLQPGNEKALENFYVDRFKPDTYDYNQAVALVTELLNKFKKEDKITALKINYLNQKYQSLMYRVIATSEGTQYKRNVIIPATRTDVQMNSFTGVGKTSKVAILSDIQAPYFTPNGDKGTEDADDGSAWINPFQAIMENYSLGPNEAGYNNKKPIWYHYDPSTGTSVLLKFATFTLSNGQMRISINSEDSHYKLFKKMTNLQWQEFFDLTKSSAHKINKANPNGSLDFGSDILSKVKGNSLYYSKRNIIKQIIDLEYDNDLDVYFTKEKYINGPNASSQQQYHLVAQLFDQDSNIVKIEQEEGESQTDFKQRIKIYIDNNEQLHTINSLFELHTSMGGIDSVEKNNDGYTWSENSNYAVVAFMNNVTKWIKNDSNDTNLNQDNWHQTLKDYHIGYAANTTAVKRGQFNVNSSSVYTDNTPLLYTVLSNAGLGIQQNGDHEADQAELSEPTQVIASLDAGGYTHEFAKMAFQDLGRVAAEGLRVEVEQLINIINKDATKEEKQQLASDIYDTFARAFINTYIARNITDLSTNIINALKANFIRGDGHQFDNFKLPISDPNIFNDIIANFTSRLNKKSLKRKYAGLGTIMVPGYKKAQVYHIGKDDLLFDDVLDNASTIQYTETFGRGITRTITSNAINRIVSNAKTTRYIKTAPDGTKNNAWFFKLSGDNTWRFNESLQDTERYQHQIGFEIVQSNDDPKLYFIHYKLDTESGISTNRELTHLERARLYLALNDFLPIGSNIAIDDDTTLSGHLEINNLQDFGFTSNTINVTDIDGNEQEINVYTSNKVSQIQENKLIVKAYLDDIQEKSNYKEIDEFQPVDIAVIDGHPNIYFDLEDIMDYYHFIDRDWNYFIAKHRKDKSISAEAYIEQLDTILNEYIQQIIENYKIQNIVINQEDALEEALSTQSIMDQLDNEYIILRSKQIKFKEDLTKPRSLRPQRIQFTVGGKVNNLYNLKPVRDALYYGQRDRKAIQQAINDLVDKHVGSLYTYDENLGTVVLQENVQIDEESIDVQEAELMMSNIYKTTFDQGNNTLAKSIKSFVPRKFEPFNIPYSDLVLVGGKKQIGICFKKPSIKLTTKNIRHKIIGNKIMALSKDKEIQEPIYQIGIQIESPDYQYDLQHQQFIQSDGEVVEGIIKGDIFVENKTGKELFYKDGKVYQNIYFVKKYYGVVNFGRREKNQSYYYFDQEAIKKYYSDQSTQDSDKLIQEYIGNTLYRIALDSDCVTVQLNGLLKSENLKLLKNILQYHTNIDDIYDKSTEIAYKFINAISDSSQKELNLYRNPYRIEEDGIAMTYSDAVTQLYEKLKQQVKQSFILSRYFTVARIPAQSLQSYMKMKLVGFIPIGENECMVSHIQTLLQGSDYDIDKAYIMGYSFDKNGRFLKWSPLFDFSSQETLNASLRLPTSAGIQVSENDIAILDINNDLQEIYYLEQSGRKAEMIDKYAEVIKKIDEAAIDNTTTVRTIENTLRPIFDKIRSHEEFLSKINPDYREDIYKNAVSARTQIVSSNPKNMPLAYSPITISDLRKQSERSSKGNLIYGLTGMNPATKFIMQKQNMDGKAVIGISAVGEKVFMYLSYYKNEAIRTNDDKWTERVRFTSTTTRIQNRSKQTPIAITKTTIADTNWYGIENADELKAKFNDIAAIQKTIKENNPYISNEDLALQTYEQIENHTQADLLISQLLSAATDNAKELILNKINAGKDLARVYLHLLIEGYDLADIVSFMTSPAVELISKLLEVNMFNEYDNFTRVKDAIAKAKGEINIYKYISTYELRKVANKFLQQFSGFKDPILQNFLKNYNTATNDGLFKAIFDWYWKMNPEKLEALKIQLSDDKNIWLKFIRLCEQYSILQNEIENTKQQYISLDDEGGLEKDIDEFEKIYERSQETTNLGTLLGWNRGMPTSFSELLHKIHMFEHMMEGQADKYMVYKQDSNELDIDKTIEKLQASQKSIPTSINIQTMLENISKEKISSAFDFHRFMIDKQYRELAIDFYNIIKDTHNIFDVITRIPNHFVAFQAYDTAYQILRISSVKAAIVDEMRILLKKQRVFFDEDKIKKLINYSDELLISKFLYDRDIKFPINKGQEYYTENMDIQKKQIGEMQSLKTYYDVASFKKWFENYLLPQIANGIVYINGEQIKVDSTLYDLTQYIIDGTESGYPIKKMSFRMSNIEKDNSAAAKYQKAMLALRRLDDFNSTPYKIADYVMLYSLLVYKNKPGNDRMTQLFGTSLMKGSNLISDYVKYLGEEDYKVKFALMEGSLEDYLQNELGFTTDTAQFKMAPIYSKYTKRRAQEKFIIVSDRNGSHYETRDNPYATAGTGYDEYNGLPFLQEDSQEKKSDRLYNFMSDAVLYAPYIGMPKYLKEILKGDDADLIRQILDQLQRDRILKIRIDCHGV